MNSASTVRLASIVGLIFFSTTSTMTAENLFSFGLKGGFPFTYSVDRTQPNAEVVLDSSSRNFIAGPTGEINLPLGFSVEADALYHPFNVRSTAFTLPSANDIHNYTVFEIPIVAKLRLGRGFAKPYVEAGPEFRTTPASLSLSHDGFVLGGGLEFKLGFIKISPEIRYTRWASSSYAGANDNQAAVLLGVSF
jgi:hypothetical protein